MFEVLRLNRFQKSLKAMVTRKMLKWLAGASIISNPPCKQLKARWQRFAGRDTEYA